MRLVVSKLLLYPNINFLNTIIIYTVTSNNSLNKFLNRYNEIYKLAQCYNVINIVQDLSGLTSVGLLYGCKDLLSDDLISKPSTTVQILPSICHVAKLK